MKEAGAAILLQADEILVKPMAPEILIETIRERLRRGTADGPYDSIRVLPADRYDDGILIVFTGGTSFVYTPEFLYEHRALTATAK